MPFDKESDGGQDGDDHDDPQDDEQDAVLDDSVGKREEKCTRINEQHLDKHCPSQAG